MAVLSIRIPLPDPPFVSVTSADPVVRPDADQTTVALALLLSQPVMFVSKSPLITLLKPGVLFHCWGSVEYWLDDSNKSASMMFRDNLNVTCSMYMNVSKPTAVTAEQ